MDAQDDRFPPVGFSRDYNGKIVAGKQGAGRISMARVAPPEVILIFRGTHQVLSAEKALKKGGVPMRLIPVPRRLTSDCGLAIRIFPTDKDRARKVLLMAGLLPRSVHILREEGMYDEEPF
jgi:ribosomal protein L16/L10AE